MYQHPELVRAIMSFSNNTEIYVTMCTNALYGVLKTFTVWETISTFEVLHTHLRMDKHKIQKLI